jgi:hypothetical protein
MNLAKGSRPTSIQVFATLFALQALLVFAVNISDIDGQLAYFSGRYPQFGLDRDAIIVIICARLSIAAFPIALVWFFAKSFAKWFCAAFAALRLTRIPSFVMLFAEQGILDWSWLLSSLLMAVAVAALFTRESSEWFRQREVDSAVFE